MIRPFCESCNVCKYCDDILTDLSDKVGDMSICSVPISPDTGYCCPNKPMTDCVICKRCEYLIFCFKDYYYSKSK